MKTDITDSLKQVINGMFDSYTEGVVIPFNVEEMDFANLDPSDFWYKYVHKASEQELSAYQHVISQKTNFLYAAILINHHNLETELSHLFKQEVGHTCSTDKAYHVLKYCLKRSLKLEAEVRKKFVVVSGNRWFDFISNHPFVRHGKLKLFLESGNKLMKSFSCYHEQKKEFAVKVISKYSDLSVSINNKPVKIGHIASQCPLNALDWLNHEYPGILAIEKSRRRNCRPVISET